MDISARNECISSVLPHRPSSVTPSISLILYWQTAIQLDPAENTRVGWHWNDVMWNLVVKVLFVHELSLVRSPGVFTPLLFVRKPEFLINNSESLGSASISVRCGAFPNGGTTQRMTRFRNRSSHTSRSCGRGPNVAMCFARRAELSP